MSDAMVIAGKELAFILILAGTAIVAYKAGYGNGYGDCHEESLNQPRIEDEEEEDL